SEQSFIVSKTVEVYKFLPRENGVQEFLLNFCGVEREFEFEFSLPRDEKRRGSREVTCVIRSLRQALHDFIFENYSDDSGGSRASINQVHTTLASLGPREVFQIPVFGRYEGAFAGLQSGYSIVGRICTSL